ncbi:hypothetical protein PG988_001590 [Apiospora saccharicola]
MSAINHVPVTYINGAGRPNLDKMNHHISELEKCANAYFRDVQVVSKRDRELELRFIDWNYSKCALDRITQDFADRLIKREESFAARNMWINLEHEYAKHDSDWQKTATRTTNRAARVVDYVQHVKEDEALWYRPSSNLNSSAKLLAERPKQISPAPSKIPGVKDNGPVNNTPTNNALKSNPTKAVKSKTNVTPVPPHLRGAQKSTPTTVKQLATPESNEQTAVKPKTGAWVPPHLRSGPSKETRVSNAMAAPEKTEEEKIPPHLRGSSNKGPKVTNKTQAPVTPPAAVASPDTSSDANGSVSSSKSSTASNILIDVSDEPATVFESSSKNETTHGTTGVWEALLQLTNCGSMAGTSAIQNETCDLLW